MTCRGPLFVALLLGAARLAGADAFTPPPMKDGFWEMHTRHTQQGKPVSDTVIKLCQSSQQTKSLQAIGADVRKKNECTSTITRRSGDTVVEESRCAKGANAGSVTTVIYTHDGDTASHTEMRMTVGASEVVMISDAKYLGSCPAGMKPGDIVMPDGKKISGGD